MPVLKSSGDNSDDDSSLNEDESGNKGSFTGSEDYDSDATVPLVAGLKKEIATLKKKLQAAEDRAAKFKKVSRTFVCTQAFLCAKLLTPATLTVPHAYEGAHEEKLRQGLRGWAL